MVTTAGILCPSNAPTAGRVRVSKIQPQTAIGAQHAANLPDQRVQLGKHVRAHNAYTGPLEFCVELAAAIYDGAQTQYNFSLPPFYAEEWKQKLGGAGSDLASRLPPEHWPTAHAARFLNGDTTAKQFLGEIDRLGRDLAESHNLLECWRAPKMYLPPMVRTDRDGAITIHHAGKVCEINFKHGEIIMAVPTTCTYYFDQDAILEPCESGEPDLRKMAEQLPRIGGKHKDLIDPLSMASSATNIGRKRSVGGTRTVRTAPPSWKGSQFDGPRDLAIHPNVGRRSGNKSHKAVAEYEQSGSEEHRTKAGLLLISDTAYPARNKRSVWTVATQPFSEAHFATFPPALIEPCILAGAPEGGVVLDPFGGAGTVGLVAERLKRNAVLIELNPDYCTMAERRIRGDAPLFAQIAAE